MKKHRTDCEIIGYGNIVVRWTADRARDKRLARNRAAIEKIWREAVEESGGKLFNGLLLNFVGLEKRRTGIEVRGSFVEYKHFIVQRRHPELELGIKPIGVSGIIIFSDSGVENAVFAERGGDTTEYRGFLELVPSGGIDRECADENGIVDYKSKLLSEFAEETGLSNDCIMDISEFAIVLDTKDKVYDICCRISVDARKEIIIKKFRDSKEYKSPVFVPVSELKKFVRSNRKSLVPTSIALVDAFIMGK
ncbi:MAG: hypothetical protein AB1546_11845 [bacterium]